MKTMASAPNKRRRVTATSVSKSVKVKPSNRPRYSASEDDSESDDDDLTEAQERAAMLAALEAHQLDFMATAVPSSTSASQYNRKPSTTIEKQQHTWEDMDDEYDDAEAVTDENSDSEDSVDEEDRKVSTSRVPEVAIFQDPSASNSAPTVFSFAEPAGSAGLGTNKDMKKFMSSKVRNAVPTFSVADAMNSKGKGRQRKAADLDNTEEESHLASLDDSLSALIRPLTAPTTASTHTQLPQLLMSLPTAPTKLLKGLTPLPANTPRTLRRGQSAANLKRARGRDEAAGVVMGAKQGREATTLKEKRSIEGTDKRARGMKGAVGKMRNGGLVLSREEVAFGSGDVMKGSSKRGGRGGARGGRGGKRK